jgi:hypothetical protein
LMRFTVRLGPGPAPELFSASFHPFFTRDPQVNSFLISPGDLTTNTAGVMYTRWAEVCYFLLATGAPGDPSEMTVGGNPRPLHSLRRRLRLLPPREVDYQEIAPTVAMTTAYAVQVQTECIANFPDVIPPVVIPNPLNPAFATLRLPGPETLNKAPGLRLQKVAHPTGDDILLTDVISFEIRAAWNHNPLFNVPPVAPFSPPLNRSPPPEGVNDFNTDEPFADLRPSDVNPAFFTVGDFDTWGDPGTVDWDNAWSSNGFLMGPPYAPPRPELPPTRINVRGLQIKLRIWDKNAEQARQVTIVSEI